MKILVIGSQGMLGHDLIRAFQNTHHEIIGAGRTDLDIRDGPAVVNFIHRVQPKYVILTAAYTKVDDCESNLKQAFAVNTEGPKNVAFACHEINAKLCFISTDYVFDGNQESPYGEKDIPNPKNIYGRSKLAGEKNVKCFSEKFLIIRTSWLYGIHGKNFVETFLVKSQTQTEFKIVDDQIGAPTYTKDLAVGIVSLIEKDSRGIVNVANSGCCSWYQFAKKILELVGLVGVIVHPVSSKEFQAPASRPANSQLAGNLFKNLVGYNLRSWQEALMDYLDEREKQNIRKHFLSK